MFKQIRNFFVPEKYPVDPRIDELVTQVYLFSGTLIHNAYSEKQVRAACLDVASAYPVSAEVTLMALRGGEAILSRHFIERLVDIGREKHDIE